MGLSNKMSNKLNVCGSFSNKSAIMGTFPYGYRAKQTSSQQNVDT